MKIIVCIGQVPDINEIRLDPVTGMPVREGVTVMINPDDKAGLEAALRLKDETGAEVSAITMGPPQADTVLREAMAMGADHAYLITDPVFSGSDTLATSFILAAAIKNLEYDLVIVGQQANDGNTAQIGPQLAEYLDIPGISYAKDIKTEGSSIIVKSQYEDRYHIIRAKMPCLITVLADMNKPRYMTPGRIFEAYLEEKVIVWGHKEIDIDDGSIGLQGSPTQVTQIFTRKQMADRKKVILDAEEAANFILESLKEKYIL